MKMIEKTSLFLNVNEFDLSVGEYQLQHLINPLIEIPGEPLTITNYYETGEAEEDNELTDEEIFNFLNLLQFEQIKFEKSISENGLEVIYNVVNIGHQRVTYFDVAFAYYDNDDCITCTDDRFHDCALEVGKKGYVRTYPILAVGDISEIVSVQPYRYEYRTDDYIAKIDLQSKEYYFERIEEIDEDVLEELNVLNIKFLRKESTSWGDEVYLFKITNIGNIPIRNVTVDYVYYNEQRDPIYTDCRYEDILLDINKSLKMESYVSVEDINEKVAYSEPYSYKYELLYENEYGVREVSVNLQTKLCR